MGITVGETVPRHKHRMPTEAGTAPVLALASYFQNRPPQAEVWLSPEILISSSYSEGMAAVFCVLNYCRGFSSSQILPATFRSSLSPHCWRRSVGGCVCSPATLAVTSLPAVLNSGPLAQQLLSALCLLAPSFSHDSSSTLCIFFL